MLYATMAIAAWIGVKEFGWRNSKGLIGLYLAQLTVNVLWSVFFFGMHLGGVALVVAITLCVAVVATTVAMYRTRRAAGVLLLPYAVWVTFAAALTRAVWSRNPSLL